MWRARNHRGKRQPVLLIVVLVLLTSMATTGAAYAYFSDSVVISTHAETGEFAYTLDDEDCVCITFGCQHEGGCGVQNGGYGAQFGLGGPFQGWAFGQTLQHVCGFSSVGQLQTCHLRMLGDHMRSQCGCGQSGGNNCGQSGGNNCGQGGGSNCGEDCGRDCCTCEAMDTDDDGIKVTLTDANCCAFGLVWFRVTNVGSIPLSIQQVDITCNDFDNGDAVGVWPILDPSGRQLETQDDPATWYDERSALYVAGIHVYEPGDYTFYLNPQLSLWCEE